MNGKCIIVMGVCASGKSTIAEKLAVQLKAKFIDADDLHPKKNILKMAGGQPLDDDDRFPWLARVSEAVSDTKANNEVCFIACSALKKKYREQIRSGNENTVFIYLEGTQETITARMKLRQGHFMKSDMVSSQFVALQSPVGEKNVLVISIEQDQNCIIEQAISGLNMYKLNVPETAA